MNDAIESTRDGCSQRTHYSVTHLLIVGLVFHLIYIRTVFDCYFTSPVVNGMQSYNVGYTESKRLVLIVGDGLRADLLFNVNPFPSISDGPEFAAPYLRSIAETRGAFGISHTRVPTESRPGHVALIGGMYEDVSAVTKGWKTNPVDFDSVFNQSSFTFSFGSPDILPMFSRGATPGKVQTWSYNEDDEDFTKDATALDLWVLDQLQELFKNATTNATLHSQLQSGKLIFFLHLLGLDTTGHSYRPHSREYMRNIQVVDDIVRQAEALMSEYYQDSETSYIFTADHGMSVIGNHGDGDPDNTRTPLIAWGRGVRGPLPDSSPSSHDSYSEPWRLSNLLRRDVDQADVAALMACLLDINWPVNSVGVLPDVDPTRPGYLSPYLGEEPLAQAALVNAKVIIEQYVTKHKLKKARTVLYKPFPPLERTSDSQNNYPYRTTALRTIEDLINNENWFAARKLSTELIIIGLNGLHYLQTYERLLIRGFVTVAYIGWAAYASLFIFRPLDHVRLPGKSTWSFRFVNIITAITVAGFWTLFTIQASPWLFYVYVVFPCYFWREVLHQSIPVLQSLSRPKLVSCLRVLIGAVAVLGVLQAMVVAYSYRFIWSLGFVSIGVVWPLTWPKERRKQYPMTVLTWATSCLVTSIFPILSVEKKESLSMILAGGVVIPACGWGFAFYGLEVIDEKAKQSKRMLMKLYSAQVVLILAMTAVTASSVLSLKAKNGLPFVNQVVGWIILGVASLLPFVYHGDYHTPFSKFLVYFLGFGPCFIILSISIEGLFYVSYVATLTAWVVVESIVRNGTLRLNTLTAKDKSIYQFRSDDLRIALFFLFFVQVGFFGIGNVASISSFYLEPVYRLIPIFSPFFMATLLIFKIVAPYIMLSIATALLNDFLRLPPFSLLLVALTLTDGMTITFFFSVRDTGSWLEIGQSITFFCITSLLLLWSTGICAAGEYLMADVIGAQYRIHIKDD